MIFCCKSTLSMNEYSAIVAMPRGDLHGLCCKPQVTQPRAI